MQGHWEQFGADLGHQEKKNSGHGSNIYMSLTQVSTGGGKGGPIQIDSCDDVTAGAESTPWWAQRAPTEKLSHCKVQIFNLTVMRRNWSEGRSAIGGGEGQCKRCILCPWPPHILKQLLLRRQCCVFVWILFWNTDQKRFSPPQPQFSAAELQSILLPFFF